MDLKVANNKLVQVFDYIQKIQKELDNSSTKDIQLDMMHSVQILRELGFKTDDVENVLSIYIRNRENKDVFTQKDELSYCKRILKDIIELYNLARGSIEDRKAA